MIFGKYLPPLPLHFGGSIRGLNGCTHLLARLPEVLRFCRTAVPPYLHIQNCCRFCVPPVSCWRLRAGKCGVMNHAPLFLARILPFNMTIQLRLTRADSISLSPPSLPDRRPIRLSLLLALALIDRSGPRKIDIDVSTSMQVPQRGGEDRIERPVLVCVGDLQHQGAHQ